MQIKVEMAIGEEEEEKEETFMVVNCQTFNCNSSSSLITMPVVDTHTG